MREFPANVFVRVCHVGSGHEDRERHIRAEFARRGVPVHFFLDWDVASITDELLDRFVEGGLSLPVVSLALKHIGIWREFLETGMPFCLVFEDDVFLDRDFVPKLEECIAEFGDPRRKAAVYLGNGGNYYTPRRRMVRGRRLYEASHCRCTDSYLISRPVAEARCRWFAGRKLTRAIDHQIDIVDPELGVEILWFERPIVEAGTNTGAFRSSISASRKWRPSWYRRLEWNWKKHRRRLFQSDPG